MEEKFEAPSDKPEFKFYWDIFVEDVTKRDNFKLGHLQQLKILCRLYTEFDKMSDEIDEKGFTYETDPNGESRYGNQIKINPISTQRDKILSEIRQFSKLLKLELFQDADVNIPEEPDSPWKA